MGTDDRSKALTIKVYDAIMRIYNARGYDVEFSYTVDGMSREEYIKKHNLDMSGFELKMQ